MKLVHDDAPPGPTSPPQAEDDRPQSPLEDLWATVYAKACTRVEILGAYIAGHLVGLPAEDLKDPAQDAAHKLAGTLGTFGLPEGSRLASAMEARLEAGPLDDADLPLLAEQVERLRTILRDTPAVTPPPALRMSDRPVLILAPARALTESILFEARRRGFEIRLAAADEVGAAAALVVLAEDIEGAMPSIRHAAGCGAQVVAFLAPPMPSARMALFGAGADTVLGDDVTATDVVDALAALVAPTEVALEVALFRPPRDGSAEPDPWEGLPAQGVHLQPVKDPDELWAKYPGSAPEAVLLDATARGPDAVRWCRAIRSDPMWARCTVVAVTAPGNRDLTGQLLAAGADDCLELPASAEQVTHRLRARVERLRVTRVSADPVTGRTQDVGTAVASVVRRKEILVVEDDEVVAALLHEVLAGRGYGVRVLTDGVAASTALADPDAVAGLDLVLLDISLPGTDGFGVLRRMRSAGTCGHVPVILLTGRSRPDEVLLGLELGACDHVAKPFSVPVLLHKVTLSLKEHVVP